MRVTAPALAAFVTGSGLALAAPFPLEDGFPSPSTSQVAAIQVAAGGALPNSALPTTLSDGATTALQLIALNENFEVAFFTSLLSNITNGVQGFEVDSTSKEYAISALTAIQKQEELHALGANGILSSASKENIAACEYQFPSTDFQSAIAFAQTFTDLVLAVLPQAQTLFATDAGDEMGLVQLLGSIIGQEGEQNGWYRSLQQKTPSAAPFLTYAHPIFAFNALQQTVLVPGSCPQLATLSAAIPTLGALSVTLDNPQPPADCVANFSLEGIIDASSYSVVYLSGQQLPVVVQIENVSTSNGVTTFSAPFPFGSKNFSNGLTVASVVQNNGAAISTLDEVVQYAKFGPGLIELL